jgi:hypothetical protein
MMIKWTFKALEALNFFTLRCLVNQWMKLLFLPPMTVWTFFEPLASLLIACDECATLPVRAKFSLIPKKIRFSSEILKIVSVHALSFVVFMVVRAPFGFEKENVKVEIRMVRQQVVDQSHFNIIYGMSERAILSIFTDSNFVWITVAKFSFILIFVI